MVPPATIVRRIFLIALLTLPQWYWFGYGSRVVAKSGKPLLLWIARVFMALFAVAMVLILSDRIIDRYLPPSLTAVLAAPVQLWIFTSTFAFFFIGALRLIAAAAQRIWKLVARRSSISENPARRSVLQRGISVIGAIPFVVALYGFAVERRRYETVRMDIPIPHLPDGLDGLRIVQLSDLHTSDFLQPSEVGNIVDLANGLSAHVAVVTGDFITSKGDPLADCIAELSRLRAPLGIWGCNGNHEIYAEAEDEAERLFQLHGMRLLRTTAAAVSWNGAELNLIGVDYQKNLPFTGGVMPSLEGVEALVRRDMPNILLSHNPNSFYRAAELGIELSLAGHTHGGQVNVEILHRDLNPALFVTKFIRGIFRLPLGRGDSEHNAQLYVNRGLGTLGVPARIGAAPEITLITLRKA